MAIVIRGDIPLPLSCVLCIAAQPNQFNELKCYAADDLNVTTHYFDRHPNCPMEEVDDDDI